MFIRPRSRRPRAVHADGPVFVTWAPRSQRRVSAGHYAPGGIRI